MFTQLLKVTPFAAGKIIHVQGSLIFITSTSSPGRTYFPPRTAAAFHGTKEAT